MKRIRKDEARKRYNNMEPVFIVPCKVNPYNVWGIGGVMIHHPDAPRDFDSYINAFEYYNCCNEMGRYAAFYIEEVTA